MRNDLFEALSPFLPNAKSADYHPHITIGYKDIPAGIFKEAEALYLQKELNALFNVDGAYLWKHDGKKWEIVVGGNPRSCPEIA